MSSVRGAATGVGRIGALAVALGIGAAVAGGTGVAWAEDSADAGAASQTTDTDTATANATTDQTGAGPVAETGAAAPSAAPARRTSRAPSRSATTVKTRPPAGQPAAAGRNSVVLPSAAVTVPQPRPANDLPAPQAPVAPAPTVVVSQAAPRAIAPAAPRVAARVPAAPSAVSAIPVPAAALVSVPVTPVLAPVIAPSAAVTQAVAAPPRGLVSRLLSAVGLSALGAGSAPAAPVANPALWGLMAWTRRESTRTLVRSAASAPAQVVPTAAVVATPSTLPTTHIAWVTGQRNSAFPGSTWPQTNNTRWANIYGTDLGIMWFNEDNGLTQLAFGDTFSAPNMTGVWINNALLLSDDTQLSDGLTLINTGPAFQFIPDARDAVFFIGSEVTNIPTAAVYANGTNYVNYMSVKSWDSPGRWTTNYSAVSQFVPGPNGGSWQLQRSTIRSAGWFRSSTRYRAGDQNFQQMAYVLQPESKVVEGQPRYVYAFGTPSGRQGSAYLSRVPEGSVTDLKQYEYWDGDSWVRDRPAVATEVIGTSKSSGLFGFVKDLANNPNFFGGWFAGLFGAKTGGNVSEMSVQYNEYLGKYVMMYGDGLNNIQVRVSDSPEQGWSDPIQVASSITYPGLYAPMIHPLSGTGQLTDANGDPDVSNLYWNMSLWGNYNVVLMKTDLSPLGATVLV